tara:strand:- start:446 stop:934 length:489 start_codon:yes stop_codon:yes gene_type:complete
MVTLADRKIGTNVLVNLVNIRSTLPQKLVSEQRHLQKDYNSYVEYLSARCEAFVDRGWKINIMNDVIDETINDRSIIHPLFHFKKFKKRKFIPEDEIRSYNKIFVAGVFLQHQVLEKYQMLRRTNPETYITPTISFCQEWGYDTQKNENWKKLVTLDMFAYV